MGNDTQPIVSVVTSTRNRPQTIQASLESVAAQSLRRLESIVVDDGSDGPVVDAYEQIIGQLDERFVFHKRPVPGLPGTGPSSARNRGIELARGRFIAFCDDDDCWRLEDHLQVAVDSLESAEADFFFANMQGESNGQVTIPDWFPDSPQLVKGLKVHQRPDVYQVGLKDLMTVMRHHYPHPNGCVIRRSLLDRVGLFWKHIDCAEDINLVMRVADQARGILFRPDCVVGYNVSPRDSAFTRTPKIDLSLFGMAASQHARVTCQHAVVRRCARSFEAWNMRNASAFLLSQNRPGAACSMAWQAMCVYPTLGCAVHLVKTISKVFSRSWRRSDTPSNRVVPTHQTGGQR